ncbi:MAG: RNA-binding protein [Spirochaetales bacterium]|nr:RNA-binding protein [Spirochaetales bacterium]
MNHETTSVPGQEEVVAGKIKLIATDMLTDAHPEELDALKKSIKKHVPLMRRGYFTAYLLRELLKKSPEGSVKERSFEKARRRRPEREGEQTQMPKHNPERAKTPEEQAPNHQNSIPEGAKTIYINIGKMRRLYSKDLSQLLQNELEISREEIFSIRVHDKYSFVTLSEAHAELAIAKLNGKEIKGRVASVSYSNKD